MLPLESDPVIDRIDAIYHEVGHAVALHHFGRRLKVIRVVFGDAATEPVDDSHPDAAHLWAECIIIAAGQMADLIHRNDGRPFDYDTGAGFPVMRDGKMMLGDNFKLGAYLRAEAELKGVDETSLRLPLEAETRQLLVAKWPAVEALVNAFLDVNSVQIDGTDAEEIIERALASPR